MEVQGGSETHCQNTAVNLAKLGHEVTVFIRPQFVDKHISANLQLKEYNVAVLEGIK